MFFSSMSDFVVNKRTFCNIVQHGRGREHFRKNTIRKDVGMGDSITLFSSIML